MSNKRNGGLNTDIMLDGLASLNNGTLLMLDGFEKKVEARFTKYYKN